MNMEIVLNERDGRRNHQAYENMEETERQSQNVPSYKNMTQKVKNSTLTVQMLMKDQCWHFFSKNVKLFFFSYLKMRKMKIFLYEILAV